MIVLTRLLSKKKSYEKAIIFKYKFPKFTSKYILLQNVSMPNLVILKWRLFEYKAKFEKKPLLLRSEIGIFEIFFKRLHEKSFEDL